MRPRRGRPASRKQWKRTTTVPQNDEDASVLQPPLKIQGNDVVKIVESGTHEIRELLRYECDLIYECRVCRSLFRSVANFVAHKRTYCKASCADKCESVLTPGLLCNLDAERTRATVVVHPEPVPPADEPDETAWQTPDDLTPPSSSTSEGDEKTLGTADAVSIMPHEKKKKKKDLGSVLQRLRSNAEKTTGGTYESVQDILSAERSRNIPDLTVLLERMDGTTAGMFQTVSNGDGSSTLTSTKKAVQELEAILVKDVAVLGPDGKLLAERITETEASQRINDSVVTNSEKDAELTCHICKIAFSSRKTLRTHTNNIHTAVRNHYRCPCCDAVFLKSWSVSRHLQSAHRKTPEQVAKLKTTIMSRMFRKKVSPEMKAADEISNKDCSSDEELEVGPDKDERVAAENHQISDKLGKNRLPVFSRSNGRLAYKSAHRPPEKRIGIQIRRDYAKSTPVNDEDSTVNKKGELKGATDNCETDIIVSLSSSSPCPTSNACPPPSTAVAPIPSQLSPEEPPSSTLADQSSSALETSPKPVMQQISIFLPKIDAQIPFSPVKSSSSANSSPTYSPEPSFPVKSSSANSSPTYSPEPSFPSLETVVPYEFTPTPFKIPKRNVFPILPTSNSKEIAAALDTSSSPVTVSQLSELSTVTTTQQSNMNFVSDISNTATVVTVSSATSSSDSSLIVTAPSLPAKPSIMVATLSLTPTESHISPPMPVTQSSASRTRNVEMDAKMLEMINLAKLQCQQCQKKFGKLANLKRHVAAHLGWNRYRCTKCGFRCFNKCDCQIHVIRTHYDHLSLTSDEKSRLADRFIQKLTHSSPSQNTEIEIDLTSEPEEEVVIVNVPSLPTVGPSATKTSSSNSNSVVEKKIRPLRKRKNAERTDFVYSVNKRKTEETGKASSVKKPKVSGAILTPIST